MRETEQVSEKLGVFVFALIVQLIHSLFAGEKRNRDSGEAKNGKWTRAMAPLLSVN